jgi:hypothetical protein
VRRDGAQSRTEAHIGRGLQGRLLDDPKWTVEQELGSRLPEDVQVRVGGGEPKDHLPLE